MAMDDRGALEVLRERTGHVGLVLDQENARDHDGAQAGGATSS
jgi:hypothetical protein